MSNNQHGHYQFAVPLEPHTIGNAVIHTFDDEFITGYQSGYLLYATAFASKPDLTELDIYDLLHQTMFNSSKSCRWSAGFLAGWFGGMHAKEIKPPAVCPTCLKLVRAEQLVGEGGLTRRTLCARPTTGGTSHE